MTTTKTESKTANAHRLVHEIGGGAAGGITGAIVGAAAGPAGVVAGAVLGAVAGLAAGAVIDSDEVEQNKRTRELDAAIGVTEGSLGAPNLAHPPAVRGAYSAASAGISPGSAQPSEGPEQVPDE